MKNIDRLMKKAGTLLSLIFEPLFPSNDDDLLDALGVDPVAYARELSDGSTGYDVVSAMSNVAREVWSEEYSDQ